MKYYLEDVREVFKRTESSENGLTQSEAERSSGGFSNSLPTR